MMECSSKKLLGDHLFLVCYSGGEQGSLANQKVKGTFPRTVLLIALASAIALFFMKKARILGAGVDIDVQKHFYFFQ